MPEATWEHRREPAVFRQGVQGILCHPQKGMSELLLKDEWGSRGGEEGGGLSKQKRERVQRNKGITCVFGAQHRGPHDRDQRTVGGTMGLGHCQEMWVKWGPFLLQKNALLKQDLLGGLM